MKNFLIVTAAVFSGAALWNLCSRFVPIKLSGSVLPDGGGTSPLEISYVDMVSVMLTGVTIVLGALGFLVAVLAFVGWNSIRAIAEASAREVVKESIATGGKLHDVVRKETRAIIRYSGVETFDTDFVETSDDLENEDGA